LNDENGGGEGANITDAKKSIDQVIKTVKQLPRKGRGNCDILGLASHKACQA
jgi:hypothetical protein